VKEGFTSFEFDITHWEGYNITIIGITCQALNLSELPSPPGAEDYLLPYSDFVTGSRIVQDSKSKQPIADVTVSISWGYEGAEVETTRTNAAGVFTFRKGKRGFVGTVTLNHPDYPPDQQASITIPGSLGSSNVNTGEDTQTLNWATVQVDVIIPYTWDTI
jgi:hypothetical protein